MTSSIVVPHLRPISERQLSGNTPTVARWRDLSRPYPRMVKVGEKWQDLATTKRTPPGATIQNPTPFGYVFKVTGNDPDPGDYSQIPRSGGVPRVFIGPREDLFVPGNPAVSAVGGAPSIQSLTAASARSVLNLDPLSTPHPSTNSGPDLLKDGGALAYANKMMSDPVFQAIQQGLLGAMRATFLNTFAPGAAPHQNAGAQGTQRGGSENFDTASEGPSGTTPTPTPTTPSPTPTPTTPSPSPHIFSNSHEKPQVQAGVGTPVNSPTTTLHQQIIHPVNEGQPGGSFDPYGPNRTLRSPQVSVDTTVDTTNIKSHDPSPSDRKPTNAELLAMQLFASEGIPSGVADPSKPLSYGKRISTIVPDAPNRPAPLSISTGPAQVSPMGNNTDLAPSPHVTLVQTSEGTSPENVQNPFASRIPLTMSPNLPPLSLSPLSPSSGYQPPLLSPNSPSSVYNSPVISPAQQPSLITPPPAASAELTRSVMETPVVAPPPPPRRSQRIAARRPDDETPSPRPSRKGKGKAKK